MYDTITLRSPAISESSAAQIEASGTSRLAVNRGTGELVYTFTTTKLNGTYDARISLRVDRQKHGFEGKQSYKKLCEPFITLECSVHKAMAGHNVYGGPTRFQAAVKWLMDRINKALDVQLPPYDIWQVKRVDIAEVFDLGTAQNCQQWFRQTEFDPKRC